MEAYLEPSFRAPGLAAEAAGEPAVAEAAESGHDTGTELALMGLSTLVAFKRLHDDNVPLEEAMPEFVAKRAARYRGKRLKDLCAEMHAFFRDHAVRASGQLSFVR